MKNKNNNNSATKNVKYLRRRTDQILIESFETWRSEFVEIKTDVKLILHKLDNEIVPRVNEHQKILYGNPETMGKNGLIATVQGVKHDIKTMKTFFASIWSGVLIFVNALISYFMKKH
ncbi:MAG: hypothetical protein AB1349_01735 [Elusimicrobiota bacterium]